MRKLRISRILAAVMALLAAPLAATAAPTFLGPTPYLSFDDSPFYASTPMTFYLEDWEDGVLDEPGASISAVGATTGATPSGQIFVDSVDGDDGSIDGNGNDGRSLGIGPSGSAGPSTITFNFNAGVLGQYPTHAGIVFTDIGLSTSGNGNGFLTFEAFDALGISLGTIGPNAVGDGVKAGSTGEDRFYGVINSSGISKISIAMNSHDAELDHLQYGFTVPEPSSWLLAGVGLVCLAGWKKWRRQAPSL
jgi:hypothetical protein